MLNGEKTTIEELDKKLKNLQEEFESYQYFVNKKIGRESGYISADKIPAARTYDAVVDANGRGDFRTIQEALNAGRNNVYIRAGEYIITEAIKISSNNVSLIGDFSGGAGGAFIHYLNSSSDDIIYIDSSPTGHSLANIRIENIKFQYYDSIYTINNGINVENGVNDLNIINCSFNDITNKAINLEVTSAYGSLIYVNIEGCKFDKLGGGTGINAKKIQNLRISKNYFFTSNIILDDITYSFITNNYFYAGSLNNIDIKGGTDYAIITNNRVKATQSNYGIIENSTSDDYNIISNNIVTDATTANISTQGANTIKANNIE